MEGWCFDQAAYLTCCLLGAQTAAGWGAGILEIGVYKGKDHAAQAVKADLELSRDVLAEGGIIAIDDF